MPLWLATRVLILFYEISSSALVKWKQEHYSIHFANFASAGPIRFTSYIFLVMLALTSYPYYATMMSLASHQSSLEISGLNHKKECYTGIDGSTWFFLYASSRQWVVSLGSGSICIFSKTCKEVRTCTKIKTSAIVAFCKTIKEQHWLVGFVKKASYEVQGL